MTLDYSDKRKEEGRRHERKKSKETGRKRRRKEGKIVLVKIIFDLKIHLVCAFRAFKLKAI